MASALLIGLGAGWLLFGRDGGPELTAAQQKAWADFEASGRYDEGSIRVVGEKYGVTVWYATKSDHTLECVMLTPLPDVPVACAVPPDPEDEAGNWGQLAVGAPLDESGASVQAMILRDWQGDPVAVIDRWDNTPQDDWTTLFQGSELEIAKVIVKATGADGNNLQIVGYDGDTPIWLSQGERTCLYVADTEKVTTEVCDFSLDLGEKVLVEFPGGVYSVTMTNHGPVVTVIRSPGPDEPAIDDTTGEQAE